MAAQVAAEPRLRKVREPLNFAALLDTMADLLGEPRSPDPRCKGSDLPPQQIDCAKKRA